MTHALVDRLVGLADARTPRALVGLFGPPGAGKSTLAERLVSDVAAARPDLEPRHVPMDGFHLSNRQLARLGLSDVKGAPQTFDARGYAQLLDRLRRSEDTAVYAPDYDRTLHEPIAARVDVPAACGLVVTEGNYLGLDGAWGEARSHLTELWYLDCPWEVTRPRLVARQLAGGLGQDAAERWADGTDQANARLIAASAQAADVRLAWTEAGHVLPPQA